MMPGTGLPAAQQAAAPAAARRIAEIHGWIRQLKRRMERTGFPLDDPMYRADCKVEETLHTLRV
jgi:hypothetical protein